MGLPVFICASIGYKWFKIQGNCAIRFGANTDKMFNSKRTYLDCNATHPLLPEARDAMVQAYDIVGNPSSVHGEGRKARAVIDAARRDVAALVNAKPEHVIFTSGATEAASYVLTPHWQMGRAALTFSHLYVSSSEHPCMLAGGRFPVESITLLPVTSSGELALDHLVALLAAHDKAQGLPLVAVQMANNETGVVQPIQPIAAIVAAHGGVLVVDAVQSVGRISVDITKACGDYLIVSSHKIGGPKGVGALICVSDLMMPKALIRGGGQEKSHRAGTEALPAIAGFGAAAKAAKLRVARAGEMLEKRQRIESLILECDSDAVIYGVNASERLVNTVFFALSGLKAETAQIAFDLSGVALSAGSACSSGRVGPSHVLKAMGFGNNDGALRVSVCLETTDEDIDAFGKALREIAARRAGAAKAA